MVFRCLIFSVLCILPFFLSGQKEDNYPYIEDFKSSLGFQSSFDVYNYEFSDDNSENTINYSAGILYKRRISNYLELRSGLIYSEKGFIRYEPLFTGFPEFGTVPFTIFARFLDLPLQIGYRYSLNKRFTIVPSGGLILGFLINKSISSDYGQDALYLEPLTKDLSSVVYGINLSLDLEFNVSKSWYIQYGGYFRDGLNKVHETFLLSSPTSFGLVIGAFRKF
jgi:hypothetical protein